MARIETWFYQDLQKPVKVHYLDGNVFSQDSNGNVLGVNVYDNGNPVTLSGTVAASIIRSDGATVAATGSFSANRASVVLPQAAYAVPGVLSVVIKLTNGADITTLCAIVGNVYRTSTETIVDPGTIIPSIDELIERINTAVASIPADYSELWKSLAPTFVTSKTYQAGEYVTYNGGVYKFKTTHPAGTFDATQVAKISIGNELSDIIGTQKFARKVYALGDKATYSVQSGIRSKYGDVNTSESRFVHIDLPISCGDAFYYSGIGFGANFPDWVLLDAEGSVIDFASKSSATEKELFFVSKQNAVTISINGRTDAVAPAIYIANSRIIDDAIKDNEEAIYNNTRHIGRGIVSQVQEQFYVKNSIDGNIPVLKLYGNTFMGVPSVANPTEINVAGGANGLTLFASSGNLLPDKREVASYNNVTATPTTDGGYFVTGTASANTDLYLCGTDMIKLPRNGLVVSGGTSKVTVMLWLYNKNKTYLSNAYSTGGVSGIIRTDAVYYRMIIQIASGVACYDKIYPMLYDPSLLTDFVPAKQTKANLQITENLAAIPAAYYGNYIDDNGQRWFADEISAEDKCIYKRTRQFTINENSTITEINTGRGHYFAVSIQEQIYKGIDGISLGIICNRLPSANPVALWENNIDGISVSGSDGVNSIRFRVASVSSVTSVSTLKTWLASNPITGYYLLDYEEKIEIPQSQIDELTGLQSANGLTCVWSSDDHPAWFDYGIITENAVDDIKNNTAEIELVRSLVANNIPTIDCEWSHFIGYGQSWSVGGSNTVQQILTKRTDKGNLMFKGGVLAWKTHQTDSTAYNSLVPIHEQKRNGYYESPVSSQCDIVSYLLERENGFSNNGYILIGSAPGEGDKTITQLSKGTAYYQYFIDYVTAAKRLADEQNKVYMVEAFSWLNASNDANALSQLQIDLNNDIKAITGQSKDVKLITWQHEPHSMNDDVYSGFVAVHETNSNVFCAFPGYVIPRINDGVLAPNNIHFTSYGSIICGEYFGIAFKRIVNDGKLFVPVSPQKITLSGKTAIIKFNVPCAPLRFDTDIVNAADNFGFSLSDSSGNAKELVSVSLLGVDCVKLVSNVTIQSTDIVSYGYNYSNGSSYAPDAIARGNLCDSQKILSKTGRTLSNFCVCFKKPVSYFAI